MEKSKNSFFNVIEFILAAALFVILLTYLVLIFNANVFHYTARMESDIASETLVALRIFENGFIQPGTWVTSTHDWVIMAPNLAAFIYAATGDINASMGIACTVMFAILVLLMLLYYRQIGLSILESLIAVVLLLALTRPGDEPERMFFLYAAYYVSHFITLFLLLMIYNKCLRDNKVSVFVFAFTSVLALINGIQGMHAILFCYVPLLGTEIVRRLIMFIKGKKTGRRSIFLWLFVITLIAYIGTKIAGSYTLGASRNIRHAKEKFTEIVWLLFCSVINFDVSPYIVAAICILAGFGFLFTIVTLFRKGESVKETTYSDEPKEYVFWSTLPLIAGTILCVLSTTFTTAEAAPRYYLMQLLCVGCGFALFMHKVNRKWLVLLAIPVIYIALLSGKDFYNSLIVNDKSDTLETTLVADWMEENGYDYGYSTFDHANYITVMSNNKVKVRAVNSMREMEGAKWLSDKTWYPPIKSSEGPTCYIVTEHLKEDFEAFLERENPTIVTTGTVGNYTIYVLDHDYTIWVD